VVKKLAIDHGSRVADLGSGNGYFTLRLAVATGPEGTVYAVDLANQRLDEIRATAKARSLGNIETILASEDDPRLTRPVDLIFMCNTYHHLPMRIAYLSKLKRHLLPNGRIAIVEIDRTPWYYFLAAHRTDPWRLWLLARSGIPEATEPNRCSTRSAARGSGLRSGRR
jgi:ubiquinone/menaquinone biosynthesis C-methylase UbiE